MQQQKYCAKKGLGRLSRNKWNIVKILNESFPVRKLALNYELAPFGQIIWEKSRKLGRHTPLLSAEYKDQFNSHKILKSFYGNLNKFQISHSLSQLEHRLDAIVYRSGIPASIFEARNLIKHGHVKVNNSLIRDIHSLLTPGSSIRITMTRKIKRSPSSENLYVCEENVANTQTFLILFQKPLILDNIRYPVGFNREKYELYKSA